MFVIPSHIVSRNIQNALRCQAVVLPHLATLTFWQAPHFVVTKRYENKLSLARGYDKNDRKICYPSVYIAKNVSPSYIRYRDVSKQV